MGFSSAEEVTLPARFLCTVAHLVATLTVLFDVDDVTRRALGSDQSDFGDERDALRLYAYASVLCFVLELAGTFSGVSLFFPTVSTWYVLAHFSGAVLVGLFAAEKWDLGWFPVFFYVFSAIPCLVEGVVAFAVLKMRVLEY